MTVVEEAKDPDRDINGPEDIALLYDRYFPKVCTYIRYRVGDRETADDLTSEVFTKALTKLSGFKPERGHVAPWLFAIARNAVNDHFRSLKVRRWLSLDFIMERPSQEPSPEELATRGESRERLLAALKKLDPRERDVLALKFSSDLTNRVIASVTGLGESNVAVIVFRAVKKLEKELKGDKA